MRVFRSSYRDRDGRTRKTNRWYVELQDHLGVRRRIPVATDKRTAEAIGRRLEALVRHRVAGEALPVTLTKWIETLSPKLRDTLARIGLLDAAQTATMKPLAEHLEDWRRYLESKGSTARYVEQTVNRVRRLLDGCGAVFWTDVDAAKVSAYLANMRTNGASIQTSNFYLSATKSFCRWMVQSGRATASPVAHLSALNVRTDRRHDRRALSVDELRWLLDTTRNGPTRYGMDGAERALLYQLAVETGLRAGELRSLTRSSFALGDTPTVTVAAAYSKRRREDILPLRPATAARLRVHLSAKLDNAPAFNMPAPENVVLMFRADLADARAAWIADAEPHDRVEREKSDFLAYEDGAGRFADFHALRHTCGSLLAASGVHPKVAQAIMRHSTIDLTMSRYTHVFAGQEASAVAALPDLTAPVRQAGMATGTDDRMAEKRLAVRLAPTCEKWRTLTDNGGRKRQKSDTCKTAEKPKKNADFQGFFVCGRRGRVAEGGGLENR